MNIGYDLDGVIFKFGEAFNKYIQDKYNHTIDITAVTEYSDLVKLIEGYNKNALPDFLEGAEGHLLRAEIYEDAVKTINKRFSEGHKIYFITARRNEKIAIESLRRRSLLYTDIYFMHADSKHEVIKNLDLNFYIDDRMETLISIYEKGIQLVSVIRDQPWNRNKDHPLNFVRVRSLTEYDYLIEKFLEMYRMSVD